MTSLLQEKHLTILLKGDIDHHRARQMMIELKLKLETYLPQNCTLDFKDVTFMDSSGIAIVISAIRRMRELGGTLNLENVPHQPMKVLKAAGLERIITITERSEDDGE